MKALGKDEWRSLSRQGLRDKAKEGRNAGRPKKDIRYLLEDGKAKCLNHRAKTMTSVGDNQPELISKIK